MNTKNLLSYFSAKTDLPISPNEVASKIVSYGISDGVKFVGVSLDEKVVKGAGVYAEPVVCTEVYYVINDTTKWQRLVCCKELLHLFDTEGAKSASSAHISDLISNMCLGSVSQGADDNIIQTFTDHAMVFYAMAILLPLRARELMMSDYKSGKLTVDTISDWADIPIEAVQIVMSDAWLGLYGILNGN